MNQSRKKPAMGLIFTVIRMLLWALLVYILTDGRDVDAFTTVQMRIFIAFLAVEVMELVILFIYADKLGKAMVPPHQRPVPMSKVEKQMALRRFLLLFSALALGFGSTVSGTALCDWIAPALVKCLFWLCALLPLALGGISVGLRMRYGRKLENTRVGDMQQFLISHRHQARETAAKKLCLLVRLCNLNILYSLLFALLGFGFGTFGGMLSGVDTTWDVPIIFWSSFLYLCALHRIHIPAPASAVTDDPLLAKREDYPELYRIAEECGRSQGWNGKIAICFADNCNAGIHRSGDSCSIYLGVLLLNLMTGEELRAVFCHEFNHLVQEQGSDHRVRRHYEWLTGGAIPHFLSRFVDMPFEYADARYTVEFNLYRYANAIDMERIADQAMMAEASPEAAVSMLMKLKYHELFQWEEGTYDTGNDYAAEQPDKAYLADQLQLLKGRMLEREPVWRQLFHKEILSRSATHPTAVMRMEALGVRELPKLQFPEQDAFRGESRKAMAFVSEVICEELQPGYGEARQEAYLAPLEAVTAWEAAGKPVIAEEYRDVDEALRMLGRYREADALCRQAMEELPPAAACHGAFLHACYLLRSYDDAGIDMIYEVIERNHNYMDEGLSVLGEYCCLTGNQEALDTYREKAVTLAQEAKDVYAQMNELNKGDQLIPEKLPEELHNRLTEYLERIDEGQIDRVYLVRKVITREDFTSVVVIRFQADASLEACNLVMDKAFHFLDTCADWQFSLFDYESVANAQPELVKNSCIYIHLEEEDE